MTSTSPTPLKVVVIALTTAFLTTFPSSIQSVDAFGINGTPTPILGLGATFFRPKNMVVRPTLGNDSDLLDSAKFFTDAFWNGKIGGTKKLTLRQSKTLSNQQMAEFRKRYGKSTLKNKSDSRSELIICQNSVTGEVMGCAGIEISKVQTPNGKSVDYPAPLMSNLAVGSKFRRKGIAEDLVKAAEELVRKEWGYEDCYLFVEKRNAPAVKLYRKLGYKRQWEDETATTLIPKSNGSVKTSPTVLLCMKKSLGGGLGATLGRLFPFG
jgi:ribosomal protein S18 acetylase RimI-like enzyme